MIQRQSTQRTINKDALRLAEGPHLAGHVVQHSNTYRLLIIDGAIMHCTPTEYALLMRLLQQNERHLPNCGHTGWIFSVLPATAICYTPRHWNHPCLNRNGRTSQRETYLLIVPVQGENEVYPL